jgi:hypothetical protein
MISKEMFCEAIDAIQKEREKSHNLGKALEEYLADSWVIVKESPTFKMLLKMLKELMHDDVDTIEWWLFEDVEKKIYFDDTFVDVTKKEDLYDYLVSNISTN